MEERDQKGHPSQVEPEKIIRSYQRVSDHGEVFTPAWIVDEMLDLVIDEASRIESRFLEPACGSGNFLTKILNRKLNDVNRRYETDSFLKKQYSAVALMSIYGIELLEDNAIECRNRLLNLICEFLNIKTESKFAKAAQTVLEINIIQGDALTMLDDNDDPILFAEWSYLGSAKFVRRDFAFSTMSQLSSWESDSLFASVGDENIFTPINEYPKFTFEDLAK